MSESIDTREFFEAFGGDSDYQTADETEKVTEDSNEQTETEQTNDNPAQEGAEGTDTEENAEGDTEGGEEEKAAEASQEADTFTLKVNKQERTVNREEVIALAQKGSDYDRVKAANDTAKQEIERLNGEVAKMQDAYDILAELADSSKTTIPEMLDAFRINRLKEKEGLSEDAARERLAREKAESKLKALEARTAKADETPKEDRATREVREFREKYPDVELTRELVDSLMEDVQANTHLIQAYEKQQAKKKDEEIARLRAELDAERQNKANRRASPGSQADTGASRVKDPFDDFFAAFN